MARFIPGYQAEIYRGTWERLKRCGSPRIVFAVWGSVWLILGLQAWVRYGVDPTMRCIYLWALGQGGMILLTRWDVQWDSLGWAHLFRRYKHFYDAG